MLNNDDDKFMITSYNKLKEPGLVDHLEAYKRNSVYRSLKMITSQDGLQLEKIEDPDDKIMEMMPQIDTRRANKVLKKITDGVMS